VTATSKANNKADPNIRPYSLTVVEKLDRVVTGSTDMMGAQASRHRDRSSLGIGGRNRWSDGTGTLGKQSFVVTFRRPLAFVALVAAASLSPSLGQTPQPSRRSSSVTNLPVRSGRPWPLSMS
jgi:hypothetical protein